MERALSNFKKINELDGMSFPQVKGEGRVDCLKDVQVWRVMSCLFG